MEASANAALLDRPLAPPATLTPVADAHDRSTASSQLGTPRPVPSAAGMGAMLRQPPKPALVSRSYCGLPG